MNISIRFHKVTQSNRIFGLIDSETRKLRAHYPEIVNCAVVIDKPHNRHRKGSAIRAQITLSFPGKVLVFSKSANGQGESESALVALSEAFDAAEFTTNEYIAKRREAKEVRYAPPFGEAFVSI